MKKPFLSLIIILFYMQSPAQGTFEYIVTVRGKENAKLSGVKVWLQDKNTGQRIVKFTGSDGKATFTPSAGYWSLNLEGLHNYKEFELKGGEEGRGTVTIFYDLIQIRAEQEIIEKRQTIRFDTIVSQANIPSYPPKGFVKLNIKLFNQADMPVAGISVSAASVQNAVMYNATTGRDGIALFLVPIGGIYAIDVGEARNFSFTGPLEHQGVVTLGLAYEPTLVSEINLHDTITQTITGDTRATSARSLFELTVLDTIGTPAVNENVYLHEIGTNRVFKATTGPDGKAVLLIPNGSSYLLHFDYRRDIDVFNFKTVKGIGTSTARIQYVPDPRLKYPEQFIPAPDELFFVDFQNFINKQLPEPKTKAGIFSSWGNPVVNRKTRHAVLEIGLAVNEPDDKLKNISDVNLCFVIDRSGSMAGYNRIESVKTSMEKFIQEMKPLDKVALVTFNEHAYLDLPLEELGNREKMRNAIRDIEPGGMTQISNGLYVGYEELLKHLHPDRSSHLILLSDGYGSDEPKTVVEMSQSYTKKGIGISAIGVGDDYNAALLTLLTSESGGLMEHAGMSEQIYEAFSSHLSNVLYPIAKDARITIQYNRQIELRHVYGLPFSKGKNYITTCDIGKLFTGQDKFALVQFDLNNPGPEIENMPVSIELSYYDIAEKQQVTHVYEASLTWSDEDPMLDLFSDREQKKIYAIAVINQSMKVMADAFAGNHPIEAKYAIQRGIEQIMELYPGAQEAEVEKLMGQMSNYLLALEKF